MKMLRKLSRNEQQEIEELIETVQRGQNALVSLLHHYADYVAVKSDEYQTDHVLMSSQKDFLADMACSSIVSLDSFSDHHLREELDVEFYDDVLPTANPVVQSTQNTDLSKLEQLIKTQSEQIKNLENLIAGVNNRVSDINEARAKEALERSKVDKSKLTGKPTTS